MPSNSIQSEMVKFIRSQFPSIKMVPIERKLFSESQGSTFLKDLAIIEDHNNIDLLIADKYLCLASASALAQYAQTQQNVTFLKNSLKIDYRGCDRSITIDLMTIQALDLVPLNQKTSLMDVMDYTKTSQGSRLLRTNILQPPNDKATIVLRQGCIKELLMDEKMLFGLSKALSTFSDVDGFIRQIVQQPTLQKANKALSKKASLKHCQNVIQNVFSLKKNLDSIPLLLNVLDSAHNELLKTIHSKLSMDAIQQLSDEISTYMDTTVYEKTKSRSLDTLNRYLFAIKPGYHSLLDAARSIYKERMNEMNDLALMYQEEFDHLFKEVKLQYNSKREFYFTSTLKQDAHALPSTFTHVEKKGKKREFTSDALMSLNQRAKEACAEILMMTEKVILSLQEHIVPFLPYIYKVAESISLLDMLHSYAMYAYKNKVECCPEITKEGPFAISDGYHPILMELKKDYGKVVPNNTYATETLQNFHIITGENNSGKTTYLTQVAILTIMSHMGCLIPAHFASIRLVDRIFTRIGSQDCIEMNASSFLMEMKSMAYIMNNTTNRSLVIIDELGRSTSYFDAVPLCWSICEYLMSIKAFIFLSTHFIDMAKKLQDLYPTVKVHRFMTESRGGEGNNGIKFHYSLKEGCVEDYEYGIQLAQQYGWPWEIIIEARRIRAKLEENLMIRKQQSMNSKAYKDSEMQRIKRTIVDKILVLKNSTLDEEGKIAYLKEIKTKFQSVLNELL